MVVTLIELCSSNLEKLCKNHDPGDKKQDKVLDVIEAAENELYKLTELLIAS